MSLILKIATGVMIAFILLGAEAFTLYHGKKLLSEKDKTIHKLQIDNSELRIENSKLKQFIKNQKTRHAIIEKAK